MAEYLKDPMAVSVFWGRIGAAIVGLIGFGLGIWGYTISPDDAKNAEALIGSILAGIGGFLALVSKIRETKKIKNE